MTGVRTIWIGYSVVVLVVAKEETRASMTTTSGKEVAKVLPKGTARDMVTGAQRGPLSSGTLTRGTIDLMSAVGRKHRPRGQFGKALPGAGIMSFVKMLNYGGSHLLLP